MSRQLSSTPLTDMRPGRVKGPFGTLASIRFSGVFCFIMISGPSMSAAETLVRDGQIVLQSGALRRIIRTNDRNVSTTSLSAGDGRRDGEPEGQKHDWQKPDHEIGLSIPFPIRSQNTVGQSGRRFEPSVALRTGRTVGDARRSVRLSEKALVKERGPVRQLHCWRRWFTSRTWWAHAVVAKEAREYDFN